ncbi:MAG TPA: extracellular solute-binding protein [Caulobacterales bacterium]|nr:extracellular solute-binding protein [Caulobacterales bacterium]
MPDPTRRRLALGAAAFALAACTGSGSGRHVNVYSGRHYDSDLRLYAAFKAKTGIEVRTLPANGDQLLERLRVEGDQTEADLIVTADAGNLYRLQESGLLQPVVTPALEAAVPARLHEPHGYWWGFSKRVRVIAYRKGEIDPAEITSMDDLADPSRRGQICARSSSNVYNLSLLAARIERLGAANARAWAAGVKANFARDPQGGDIEQIRAIAAGECKLAITNHYYYLRLATSPDPADKAVAAQVGLIFPDQNGAGVHVNISGAGVSKFAQRKAEAIALLEFLVSDEAQRMLAPLNEEYPIRPDIAPTPALAALGSFKEEDIPLEALGRRQAEAAQIYEAVGWR